MYTKQRGKGYAELPYAELSYMEPYVELCAEPPYVELYVELSYAELRMLKCRLWG